MKFLEQLSIIVNGYPDSKRQAALLQTLYYIKAVDISVFSCWCCSYLYLQQYNKSFCLCVCVCTEYRNTRLTK